MSAIKIYYFFLLILLHAIKILNFYSDFQLLINAAL